MKSNKLYYFPYLAFVVFFLFSGCRQAHLNQIEEPTVVPDDSVIEQVTEDSSTMLSINNIEYEPPLSEEDMSIVKPDFLNDEQQMLYCRAYSLYQHMFGGDTSGIEYDELMSKEEVNAFQYETVDIGDYTYKKALGRYRYWEHFDAVIHSVFTHRFWNERNILSIENESGIYLEKDGDLYFLELGRGSGYYYNENFRDEFVLLEKTDSEILFTLIGHYTPVWPKEGENSEQRNVRRAKGYDYTIEFPMKMVRTENGWRFDEFHSALADEKDENGM